MLQLLRSQIPFVIGYGARAGERIILELVPRYFGQYLTIFSGMFGRLVLQAGYFILLANTLSLQDFGLFAGISAAGIMIGSFSAFGFTAAVFRTATTKLLLLGRYVAGFYIAFALSVPAMMFVAWLLYLIAFRDLVELST